MFEVLDSFKYIVHTHYDLWKRQSEHNGESIVMDKLDDIDPNFLDV
jgi:hypothetical protein